MFLTLGKSTVTALSSSFSTLPYRIGTRRTAFAEESWKKKKGKKKELLEVTKTVVSNMVEPVIRKEVVKRQWSWDFLKFFF